MVKSFFLTHATTRAITVALASALFGAGVAVTPVVLVESAKPQKKSCVVTTVSEGGSVVGRSASDCVTTPDVSTDAAMVAMLGVYVGGFGLGVPLASALDRRIERRSSPGARRGGPDIATA